KAARGSHLGDLTLYKHLKPGELGPKANLDPANPPPMETEYLIVTDKTRVPGVVRKDSAGRTEQDIETVFSEHPTSIEPKGNPFGNVPLPPREPPKPAAGSGAGPGAPAAPGATPAAPAGKPAAPAAPLSPHGAATPAPAASPAGGATPAK